MKTKTFDLWNQTSVKLEFWVVLGELCLCKTLCMNLILNLLSLSVQKFIQNIIFCVVVVFLNEWIDRWIKVIDVWNHD